MLEAVNRELAQQIVDSVKEVCGYNINFIEPDGTIYVSTDPARVGTFHEIGRKAAREKQTIEVRPDEKFSGTQAGVNIPFAWNGEIVAVIGISGNPEEVRRYAVLAERITHLLFREQELNTVSNEKKTRMGYAVRVLTGRGGPYPESREELAFEFGIKEKALCRCSILRINPRYNPKNLSMISSLVENWIRKSDIPLWSFHYPDEYILLFEEQAGSVTESLEKFVAENQPLVRAGIGTVQPLETLGESRNEADTACRSLSGDHCLARFEDLDLEILLADVGEPNKRRFAKKTVEKLSDHERQLLACYFASDLSLKKTAEAMFCHKNTVQYQLDRIREKTGYDPRIFQEAAVLYLGLRVQS